MDKQIEMFRKILGLEIELARRADNHWKAISESEFVLLGDESKAMLFDENWELYKYMESIYEKAYAAARHSVIVYIDGLVEKYL